MNAQQQPRFGYPTIRVPNPMRPRKKGVADHNDLPRYKMVEGRLHQLNATKGWRRL